MLSLIALGCTVTTAAAEEADTTFKIHDVDSLPTTIDNFKTAFGDGYKVDDTSDGDDLWRYGYSLLNRAIDSGDIADEDFDIAYVLALEMTDEYSEQVESAGMDALSHYLVVLHTN